MSKEEIIKNYKINKIRGDFGPYSKFLGKIDKTEVQNILVHFPRFDNYLVYGDEDTLSKVGMLLIALSGKKSVRHETFDNIVSGSYADSYEIAQDYKNCKHPLLIVYVHKQTPNLNKNEPYMIPVFNNRHMEGLTTIVLCEISEGLPRVADLSYMNRVTFYKNVKPKIGYQDNTEKDTSQNKQFTNNNKQSFDASNYR